MSNHIALQRWQPYLRSCSRETLEAKTEHLKSICDTASHAEIDCYLARVLCHPDIKYRKFFNVNYRQIAEATRSEWAKAIVAETPKLDIAKIREDYDLTEIDIDDRFLRPENFLFHSGLALVPQAQDILASRAIIDGGAYRGETAVVFRRHYPGSEVHAFEPDADNLTVLQTVADTTRYGEGIVPVHQGLAAKSAQVRASGRGHGTRITEQAAGDTQVSSLDDYAQETGIEVGCLKLDVEGIEFDVVTGALETIKAHRPILLLSVYHTPKDFLEIGPMIHRLDLNYRFLIRHLHPQLTSFFGEFMLIAVPG